MIEPIRVLIVDDHTIVREGLRTLLSEETEITVVGVAANGAEALQVVRTQRPNVVLMDLVMPEKWMASKQRGALADLTDASQVLVLTSFGDDQRVRDAIQARRDWLFVERCLKD